MVDASDDNRFEVASSHILWRFLLEHSSFPFPPHENAEKLYWYPFLTAFASIRSGRVALKNVAYRSRNESTFGAGINRKRGRPESLRLWFQSLASIEPVEDAKRPASVSTVDGNEDLVDTMATCMKVDDDKRRFFAKDFDAAARQLSSSHSDRKLDWRLAWDDWVTLLKDSIRCLIVYEGLVSAERSIDEVRNAVFERILQATALEKSDLNFAQFSMSVFQNLVSCF